MNAYDLDPNLYRTLYADLKVELSFIFNKLRLKLGMAKNRYSTRYFKQPRREDSGLTTLAGNYLPCSETLGHGDSLQKQPMRYPVPMIF